MKMIKFFMLAATLFSSTVFAHDDAQFGHIRGANLELVYKNHAISGAIAETPIFSAPFEEEFGNQIYIRVGESTIPLTLKKEGSDIVINNSYKDEEGAEKALATKVNSIASKEGKIDLTVGGRKLLVQVSSATMDGNHYVNPKFEVTQDGKKIYEFKLENGAACIMCATRLSAIILTILEHKGKL